MGYTTQFKGELRFKNELTASQIIKLETFFGEDCREHSEWDFSNNLTWIDLKFNNDFTGIKWDGSEKTYDIVEKINMIILNMRKEWSDFGFSGGEMLAQGEEVGDIWKIVVTEDGIVKSVPLQIEENGGLIIRCPHCGEEFVHKD